MRILSYVSTPSPKHPTDASQHDAQLDYYGKRLATCSSDKTIRIFNVVKGEAKGEPIILKGSVMLTKLCEMGS
jgi:WD40 repeat protein